jgi:alpha-galactosidase
MTIKEYRYSRRNESLTAFAADEHSAYLTCLFGLEAGAANTGGSSRIEGLCALYTNLGAVRWNDFKLIESAFHNDGVELAFDVYGGKLRYETSWKRCETTGIWSRKDALTNVAAENLCLFRCLSRFVMAPADFEVYSQDSKRLRENQGRWQKLHHGSLLFGSEGGRTCQGSTPYIALRETSRNAGVAFHIVPVGNWRICVRALSSASDFPYAVVEAGLSDEYLNMPLRPGESLQLPEILLQELPGGDILSGAPTLHRYLNDRMADSVRENAPVVYNTWFDYWDALEPARMRQQLAAAKELGCEVFVVDAGWFGAEEGGWWTQVGDWRERRNGALRGRMADFANEVRRCGMGFGLWVEPERVGPDAPVFRQHPEWFIPAEGGFHYPDLTNERVYSHFYQEMSRLIETYRLAWLKVDVNHELGVDPHAAEHYHYFSRLYALIRELRTAYPGVFVEGCAGGGMRLDIGSLLEFNGYFLSDNVNPLDALSISQNALVRMIPGKITKWVVLRSAEKAFPKVSSPKEPLPPSVITWSSKGRPWEGYATTDLDFAARVGMTGIMGLSGDMAGLHAEAKERLRRHVGFYKKWRSLIARSVAHLLTPPVRLNEYCGWSAVQLQDPKDTTSLLFVYRLDDVSREKRFPLRELDEDAWYAIRDPDEPDLEPLGCSGGELMHVGLPVRILNKFNAKVIVIEPQGRTADH